MTVDWDLDDIGIVTKDIEFAINYYLRMGFNLAEWVDSNPSRKKPDRVQDNTLLDAPFVVRTCFVQNETLRIRLIQPSQEGGIFRDYLSRYGEGVNLFEFRAKDLKEETSRLVALGIPVMTNEGSTSNESSEVLFDTRKFGNIILALVDDSVSFPRFIPSEGRWKLHHLGLVVRDVDQLAEYYQSMGFKSLAPSRVMEPAKFGKAIWNINGKVPEYTIKSKGIGPLQNKQGTFLMEVVQPVEGEDLYTEFMGKHGEGVMHLHFLIDDPEKEMESMIAKGFPAILTVRRPNGMLFESFYDTRAVGNLCVALWGGPPPFKARPE